jgi:hypothetical protein
VAATRRHHCIFFFTCSLGFFFVIRDLGVSCGFFLCSGCVGIGFLLGLGVLLYFGGFYCILRVYYCFLGV